MIKQKIPLAELLGDSVRQQTKKSQKGEKSVDIISCIDFFTILDKIEDEN